MARRAPRRSATKTKERQDLTIIGFIVAPEPPAPSRRGRRTRSPNEGATALTGCWKVEASTGQIYWDPDCIQ